MLERVVPACSPTRPCRRHHFWHVMLYGWCYTVADVEKFEWRQRTPAFGLDVLDLSTHKQGEQQ